MLALSQLAGLACAIVGYSIDASEGGGYHLSRWIANNTFSLDGSVSGSGNFSRYTQIDEGIGIKSNERSSVVRGGQLSIEEKERLKTIEGPVVILIKLESGEENLTLPDQYTKDKFIIVPTIVESATIDIEETWPAAYANYKKISYEGPNIRNNEVYENNGDVVTTSIDSWKLDKESLYRTYINKTYISTSITPKKVVEDRFMNRTSQYALNLNSIGSLTHLGFVRRQMGPATLSKGAIRNPDVLVSEDYAGEHAITLKVSMDDYAAKKRNDDDWMPCCSGGYLTMPKYYQMDSKGFGSNLKSVFDCTCSKAATQAQFPRIYS